MRLPRLILPLIFVGASSTVEAAEQADRLGDPLPAGAIARPGTLRMRFLGPATDFSSRARPDVFRHWEWIKFRGPLRDYCYLPEGRAALLLGSRIGIWDLQRGEAEAEHRVGGAALQSVVLRQDGLALLLTDAAGNVRDWDLREKRERRAWPTGQKRLAQAIYSPDGKRVLTVGFLPPTLKQWRLQTGEQLLAVAKTGGMLYFREAVYGPNGRTAWVAGGYTHVLEQYDLVSGQCLKRLLPDYCAYTIAPSPDRLRMLVGSRQRASEWDMETGRQLGQYRGHHGDAVNAVAYCADPSRILTGSRDGSIRRWDRQQRDVLFRWFPHQKTATQMRVSPDGLRVLSYDAYDGGGVLVESSIETGKPPVAWDGHNGPVEAVAFLPDQRRAVSGSGDGALRVWDVYSGKTMHMVQGVKLGAYAVAVGPDGDRVAAGCGDGCVREFDLADGRLLRELAGHRGFVRAATYTPDGKHLVSSADDGSIRVWDRERSEPAWRLEAHRGGVLALAASADGDRILSGGRDGAVRLWDLSAGALLRTYEKLHRGWIECVCFCGNDRQGLSGGRDGRIVQWDLATGRPAKEFASGAWIRAMAVSRDGSRVYSAAEDGNVIGWDVQTGQKAVTLAGHAAPVLAVCLSSDGKRLISGSQDTTLLVWDVGRD